MCGLEDTGKRINSEKPAAWVAIRGAYKKIVSAIAMYTKYVMVTGSVPTPKGNRIIWYVRT